jgi:hypothetical protein
MERMLGFETGIIKKYISTSKVVSSFVRDGMLPSLVPILRSKTEFARPNANSWPPWCSDTPKEAKWFCSARPGPFSFLRL